MNVSAYHDRHCAYFFFFNDTATTEIYTLSLHDALPISRVREGRPALPPGPPGAERLALAVVEHVRSEEHTSELQSQFHLVCRLLLEKKKLYILAVLTVFRKKFGL